MNFNFKNERCILVGFLVNISFTKLRALFLKPMLNNTVDLTIIKIILRSECSSSLKLFVINNSNSLNFS